MSKRQSGLERRELLALGGAAAAGLLTGISARGATPDGHSGDELIAAWNDFCESLKGAAPPLLNAPAQTPAERASALRYLTRLLRHTLEGELGDYWFLVDYWNAFYGVNNFQMVVDADGVSRTVISHVDPGGWPNWLSTSGHSMGHMVFRWLESREDVEPRCKLVKLEALDESLPASTKRVTPAERARQLAGRRAGLRQRWPV